MCTMQAKKKIGTCNPDKCHVCKYLYIMFLTAQT